MNYPVADFILRIKNGYLARRPEVTMPRSNINLAVAKVLQKEGFLSSVKEDTVDEKKMIRVSLRYENRKPVLKNVEVISKPSLRIYSGTKTMNATRAKGARIAIVSTSQGVMTGKDAQKKGIGGEILFTVW